MPTRAATYSTRASLGNQLGATTQRAAIPQLVSFQLSPDKHLQQALGIGGKPTPVEKVQTFEEGLRLAAHIMVGRRRDLQQFQEIALGVIKELKHRW